jgi:hypothetical protein
MLAAIRIDLLGTRDTPTTISATNSFRLIADFRGGWSGAISPGTGSVKEKIVGSVVPKELVHLLLLPLGGSQVRFPVIDPFFRIFDPRLFSLGRGGKV